MISTRAMTTGISSRLSKVIDVTTCEVIDTRLAHRQYQAVPRILTSDRVDLFFTDQGDGPSFVFTHSWALNSDVSPGMGEWTTRQIVDTPVRTLVDTMRMGAETDFRAEVPAFDVPALLIHGDVDASAPIEITGRKTAALLPRARLIELPEVGHGLYVTRTADRR